jgi:hypothetical protein
MLLKRAMSGKVPLLPFVQQVEAELKDGAQAVLPALSDDAPLVRETFGVGQMKKAAALVMGAAAQKYMANIDKEQEVLMAVADMVIDVYAADSAVHRTLQRIEVEGAPALTAQIAATRLFTAGAVDRVTSIARRLSFDLFGEKGEKLVAKLDRLLVPQPTSVIANKRIVADHLTEAGRYSLSKY